MSLHFRRLWPAFGAGFVGAYDPFAASLAHVYEPARRTLTTYVGDLCRLRRASDDAELDWGYLANGDLDVAGIAAWAGGASYVVSIYDQVAGDTITQAVKVNQPLFVASAQNGHAGELFDGTNDYLQGTYTVGGALSQPFNIFMIAQLDATVINNNVNIYITDGSTAPVRAILGKVGAPNPDEIFIFAGGFLNDGAADANWNLWSALFNGIASQLWINAISAVIGDASTLDPVGLTLGSEFNGATNFKGNITSLIVCDPSLSAADRAAMQTAVNTYWAVY